MAKAGTIRGLQVFISDIRACQNREQETRRVDKELGKIRAKFSDEKKGLTAYERKKYVWKLLYIYMLGYDVEFGHRQACDLIPASKYAEKQVGYMACSLLMTEKDEFLTMAINGIQNDLNSRNEAFQCIALSFVSNIAGATMAEALTDSVLRLLQSGTARPVVKKKAALCLLRLLRKSPASQMPIAANTFSPTIIGLLDERDLGVQQAAVTLLLGICARTGSSGYEMCQQRLLSLLERLVFVRAITPDYTYYQIAMPWLQIKVLRALQYFGPPETPQATKALHDVIQHIFTACGETARSNNPNKANAQYAILFEAIQLCLALDFSRDLLASSVAALSKFLSVKEPNIRYLALESLTRLVLVPEVLEVIRGQEATILTNLRDPDVSIRRRALDLLFTMCDRGNAVGIVEELVKYLVVADFTMREELVLKIAILAEKYAPTVQWYVDIALSLLERAGDFCSTEIWHRVVQLVTNTESMRAYAARSVVGVLQRGSGHESLLCTAGYVLGEYGKLIQTPPLEMFQLLNTHFLTASTPTKGLLMSSFLKLHLQQPGDQRLRQQVEAIFDRYSRMIDPDLQQRAIEYQRLMTLPEAAQKQYVLPMPVWEGRESTLLKRLQAHELADTDVADPRASTSGAAEEDLLAPQAQPTQLSAAFGGAAALALPKPPGSPSKGEPQFPAAAAAVPGSPAAALAAAAAAPSSPAAAATSAAMLDLLGDDLPGPAANGGTPRAAAADGALVATPTAAEAAAAAAAAASSTPKAVTPKAPVDPLDELFSGVHSAPPVPAPAAAPMAADSMVPYAIGSSAVPATAALTGMPSGALTPATSVTSPLSANAAAAAANPFSGPTGHMGVGMWPGAGPAAGPTGDWRLLGDVQQWYSALLVKDEGVLYEDTFLQAAWRASYSGSNGTLQLTLTNKATMPLHNLVLMAGSANPALQLHLGAPAPMHLAAKSQVPIPMVATALAPFAEAPWLQLQYVTPTGLPVNQMLALPVAAHKFMVPDATIAKAAFFDMWKAMTGPPCKLQEMVDRPTPLSGPATLGLLHALRFGAEHGYLDPGAHNEAGQAYFVCGGPGLEQRISCQCRVEANPVHRQQFRVTVASPQPVLAAALHQQLVHLIRTCPATGL